uniref:Microplusin n=1 Tax=Rhipicephalus appendiculatus TaxID=34631 RepID=A0A131YG41_RHIAP
MKAVQVVVFFGILVAASAASLERQEGEPKVVKDLTEKEFRSEMREIVKYILKHYKDVTPVSLCQRLRDFFETGVGQPKITCGEGDRS